MMPASTSDALHLYYIVWAKLSASRANAVMILKTCAALARLRPEWHVEILFSEICSAARPLLESLGLLSLKNLSLGTIFPEKLKLPHKITGDLLEGRLNHEWDYVAPVAMAFWHSRLAKGPNLIMTRNMAVLNFFKHHFGSSVAPCILELHQLKYVHALSAGKIASLTNAKQLLRNCRDRELARIACADHVFCISQSLLQRIRRHLPELSADILRSAADLHDSGPLPNDQMRDLDLLYTGQLYHWKGVHTVIEALLHLPDGVRLTIIGGNNPLDLYALRAFASNLGVAERIDWLGQLPHGEVAAYQRRAKIGVVPLPFQYHIARWFTSPIKVFEMMAAGVVLIVSDLPSMRDILQPGVTAEFARPDDPKDWARAIAALLRVPERRRQLAAAALAEAQSLTFEKRAARIAQAAEALSSSAQTTQFGRQALATEVATI